MNYEIIQLNENTWRIENGFVRLFLLTGTEKALLIDTGASLPNAKEIAESLTDLPSPSFTPTATATIPPAPPHLPKS